MTSVHLTKLFLNRLDTWESISANTARGREQEFADDLDVYTFASGRRRAIAAMGEAGQVTYTLQPIDLATVTLLRSWKGIAVQARDHRGQKWYGVFASVKVSEFLDPNTYAAEIVIQTTTTTEA